MTAQRRLLVAPLAALCAFVLAGCIRLEVTFTVEEDGSGAMEMVVALDEALLALSQQSPDDLIGNLDDLPPDATVDLHREDGFVGQVVSVPIPDMEQAAELLGSADELTDAADFGFVREGDGWRFTTEIPPLGEALAGENGAVAAGLAAALFEEASFRMRVLLPGDITEHNADRIEDGVLVWDLDWMSMQPRTLSARSQMAGVGPVVITVAAGAGVAVVVLAALAARSAVRARRRA